MCVQKPVKRVFANSLKSQLKTFFPPLNFHCLIILFSSPLSFLEQQVSFSSFSPLFFAAAIFAASKLFLEMTRNHHQIADTMTSLRAKASNAPYSTAHTGTDNDHHCVMGHNAINCSMKYTREKSL